MTPTAAFMQRAIAQRKALGLSQQEVADHLSSLGHAWHQVTVHKVEAGRRPLRFDEAVSLSDFLGIPLDERVPAPGLIGPELARLRAENASLRVRIRNAATALTEE